MPTVLKVLLPTLLLTIALVLSSCAGNASGESEPPFMASPVPPAAGKPQSLDWVEGMLGDRPVRLMIARTAQEQQLGLMFFADLAPNEGMLFVYNSPRIMTFWMKNTLLPLDLIMLDEDLAIQEIIFGMQPGGSTPDHLLPRYISKKPARFALELPAGATTHFDLSEGTRLVLPVTVRLGQ
jgi:uncharacterized protein